MASLLFIPIYSCCVILTKLFSSTHFLRYYSSEKFEELFNKDTDFDLNSKEDLDKIREEVSIKIETKNEKHKNYFELLFTNTFKKVE